jgi:hypothetical protein
MRVRWTLQQSVDPFGQPAALRVGPVRGRIANGQQISHLGQQTGVDRPVRRARAEPLDPALNVRKLTHWPLQGWQSSVEIGTRREARRRSPG